MKRVIRRATLVFAGAVGLVAVTAGTAAAGTSFNHAEPLLDSRGGAMKRVLLRALFVLASAAGPVAVTAGTAVAGTNLNHSEPVLDPHGR